MKKYLTLCLALCLLSFIPQVFAQPAGPPLSQAMAHLKIAKDDPGLLVLTNAPYVRLGDGDSLGLLDLAQEATGARVGKGNLLFFQRPQAHPFCLMLFSRQDGQAVIFTRSGKLGPKTASAWPPVPFPIPNSGKPPEKPMPPAGTCSPWRPWPMPGLKGRPLTFLRLRNCTTISAPV